MATDDALSLQIVASAPPDRRLEDLDQKEILYFEDTGKALSRSTDIRELSQLAASFFAFLTAMPTTKQHKFGDILHDNLLLPLLSKPLLAEAMIHGTECRDRWQDWLVPFVFASKSPYPETELSDPLLEGGVGVGRAGGGKRRITSQQNQPLSPQSTLSSNASDNNSQDHLDGPQQLQPRKLSSQSGVSGQKPSNIATSSPFTFSSAAPITPRQSPVPMNSMRASGEIDSNNNSGGSISEGGRSHHGTNIAINNTSPSINGLNPNDPFLIAFAQTAEKTRKTAMLLFTTIHHHAFLDRKLDGGGGGGDSHTFHTLLRSSFTKMYKFHGWKRETVSEGGVLLQSLCNKIATAMPEMQRDCTHPAWRNLWDFLDFTEEFICYYPLHLPPKPDQETLGFHLSHNGSSDFKLIEAVGTLLTKHINPGHLRDGPDAPVEEAKVAKKVAQERKFYSALLQWAENLPPLSSTYQGEVDKDVALLLYSNCVEHFSELMSKRKRHGHLSHGKIKDVLHTIPHSMNRKQLASAEEEEESTFQRRLTFAAAEAQVRAGLYVLKRVSAYLKKVATHQQDCATEIGKATTHEMGKLLDQDGMTNFVNAVVNVQSVTSSFTKALQRSASRILNELVPLVTEFLLRAEATRSRIKADELKLRTLYDNKMKAVQKSNEEAMQQWAKMVEMFKQNRSHFGHVDESKGRAVLKKQTGVKEKANKVFQQHEKLYQEGKLMYDSYWSHSFPALLHQLGELERERLELLKKVLSIYRQGYQCYDESLNQAVPNFSIVVDSLSPPEEMSSFVSTHVRVHGDRKPPEGYLAPVPCSATDLLTSQWEERCAEYLDQVALSGGGTVTGSPGTLRPAASVISPHSPYNSSGGMPTSSSSSNIGSRPAALTSDGLPNDPVTAAQNKNNQPTSNGNGNSDDLTTQTRESRLASSPHVLASPLSSSSSSSSSSTSTTTSSSSSSSSSVPAPASSASPSVDAALQPHKSRPVGEKDEDDLALEQELLPPPPKPPS